MFVLLKFFHIAFMFMGVAFALGPASMVFLLARSADPLVIRRTFGVAQRLFDISTGCYAVGIVLGIAAALSGSIDLTARWLITAYALVALLGLHGILFDRWTKRAQGAMAHAGETTDVPETSVGIRLPTYLLSAMLVLVILIVYVMVTKVTVL
jgi:hypothetical protein